MSFVAASADKQSIHSFTSLLSLLEGRGGQVTPAAEDFLTKNAARLGRCYNPFREPSAASKAKLDSGKIVGRDGGQSIELKPQEKDLAKQISEKLVLDEVEAALLLRAYRQHRGEGVDKDVEAILSKDEAFWSSITGFVFEERSSVLQVVAFLLRTADIEEEALPDILVTIISDVCKPTFASALLQRAVTLATTPVPQSAHPYAPFWSKQYAREQKALLEVYFLLFYNKLFPTGQSFLDILDAIRTTEWGTKQVNDGFFDAEARAVVNDVSILLMVVAIENLNLERAASPKVTDLTIVPDADLDAVEMLHPQTLHKVHSTVIDIGSAFPIQSGPLLLAWSFILSRITESLTAVVLPPKYNEVACELLPLDLHPRQTGAPSKHGNQSQQPVYQLLASHALGPSTSTLPTLYQILTSSLLLPTLDNDVLNQASVEPNVPGYLSVVRSLISALPLLVHPSFLPTSTFDELVSVFAALYQNPAASMLRGHFWGLFDEDGDDTAVQGEWMILDLAKNRFPAQMSPFIKILQALSGGALNWTRSSDGPAYHEEAELARRCSHKVHRYLASVSTVTFAMPPTSPLVPLPYEMSSDIDAGPLDVVSLRAIAVSRSVTIPAGVGGRIVSDQDKRPLIVSWDLSQTDAGGYSAWKLFADVIDSFLGRNAASSTRSRRQKSQADSTPGDVFGQGAAQPALPFSWTSEESRLETLTDILNTIRVVLNHDPTRSTSLIAHLSETEAALIQDLFAMLEKVSAMPTAPDGILIAIISIFDSLLSSHPGMIWTYLRGSSILFAYEASGSTSWTSRNTSGPRSILAQEKAQGSYNVTLALLDLIHGLCLEAQRSVQIDSTAFAEMKDEVLARSTRWLGESVWTSFTSWRYIDIKQKYQIGTKAASIYRQVIEELETAEQTVPRALAGCIEHTLSLFLTQASAARLAPLINATANGTNTLSNLSRFGRHTDIVYAEAYTEANLQLADLLLKISRHVLPNQATMIERYLLAQSHDTIMQSSFVDASDDIISTLFAYITATFSPKLGIHAASILEKLSYLSQDWGEGSERPSLLGHLGSIRESQDTVDALLAVASDPFVEADLQIATWHLMISLVRCQPGLAAMLAIGRQRFSSNILAGTADSDDSKTGVSFAIEVVESWTEAWDAQPALLASALAFLCCAWENFQDYRDGLTKVQTDVKIWQNMAEILKRSVDDAPEVTRLDEDPAAASNIETHCYRTAAQASAAQLLSLDLQSYVNSNSSQKKTVPSGPSQKIFVELLSDKASFVKITQSAINSNFNPKDFVNTEDALRATFNNIQLQHLRRPSCKLSSLPTYGKGFMHSTTIVANRLEGCRSIDISDDMVSSAMRRVNELDYSWSIREAQVRLLVSWCGLLQSCLAQVPPSDSVKSSLWSAATLVAEQAARENRGGQIAEAVHGHRVALLTAMLEYLTARNLAAQGTDICGLVHSMRNLFTNEEMSLLSALEHNDNLFVQPLLQAAFLTYRLSGATPSSVKALNAQQQGTYVSDTEVILRAVFTSIKVLMEMATTQARGLEQITEDIKVCTCLVTQILNSEVKPRLVVWSAHCQEMELFKELFEFLSAAPAQSSYLAMLRYLYEMVLSLAAFPQIAERMALQGLMTALTSNSLSSQLEAGDISAVTADLEDSDNTVHQQWCLMVAVVNRLVVHLGHSIPFMENEVAAFLQLYSRQLQQAFMWTNRDTLSLSGITEMHHVAALLGALVSHDKSTNVLGRVLAPLVTASLSLLQQLVYLLQHPNLLSNLVEPTSSEEQSWLQSEVTAKDSTLELSNLKDRPVGAAILQEMLTLSQISASTLVDYTAAFTILSKEDLDWPKDRNVLEAVSYVLTVTCRVRVEYADLVTFIRVYFLTSQTANVGLDEPATVGTLFDLARFCTDAIRHCSSSSSSNSISASPKATSSSLLPPYDAGEFVACSQQTLETALLLMSTQIALASQKLAVGPASSDRTAMRARRDLKELASDLVEEFLDRSPSQSTAATAENRLLGILRNFVTSL